MAAPTDSAPPISTPFPYFCNPDELPAPLPTLVDIEAAEIALPCLLAPSKKRIVVLGRLFVVKYGIPRLVDCNEGHALRTLRGIPSIPKLYAMYRSQNRHFLIMEFLPGEPLNEIWEVLSDHDKLTVTEQLRATLDRVRKLPPPSPSVFSNVTGGPVPHRFFTALTEDERITGPFPTEADFHAAIALRLELDFIEGNRPDWTPDFLRRHLASAMGDHDCVLTHGDLQLKNILVQRLPPPQIDADSQHAHPPELKVSGIVDWESAGWMPSYWEYASMFIDADWGSDWTVKFEQIVHVWPAEAALLLFARRCFDGF